ncbi:hypothetical protein [Sphingobacterium sp. LRF_L2]|uniref:hypothetical protein n=1 Tax=Sphingobacterium sp. LRF_L2 TaxID=3369421 RepID=UPI003F63452B
MLFVFWDMNDNQLCGFLFSAVAITIGFVGDKLNMDKYWRYRFIAFGLFIAALVLYDYFIN